jgi:hypothetical protein
MQEKKETKNSFIQMRHTKIINRYTWIDYYKVGFEKEHK